MDDKEMKFELPLSFSVGSQVTRQHVELAKREAASFPGGSRECIAWTSYAKRLERECLKQEELNK